MSERRGVAGSQCKCGMATVPARLLCPRCSSAMIEAVFPGIGRVLTFTVIHSPAKGFEKGAVIALVELESGARCIAKDAAGGGLEIGDRVTITERDVLLVLGR